MQPKMTYSEIGIIANVSAATVSRVITGTAPVKEDTRIKVLSTLEQLGFDVEQLQRPYFNAPRNKLPIIMNLPSIGNPFYSKIVHGAKICAEQHGYPLLINETEITSETIDSIVSLIKDIKISGMITTNYITPDLITKINSIIPVVQCCECITTLDIPYVTIDDVLVSRRIVDYLFSMGRRRIAFINGPAHYKYAQGRLEGYISSLRQNGIEIDSDLIVQLPDINFDIAVTATTSLLKSAKCPDAIFAASDVFAAGAIKAANYTGLKVPDDLAVIGFDNVDISLMTSPTITTVNQPKFKIGYSSCDMLIERIHSPNTPSRGIVMDVELIIRESTQRDAGPTCSASATQGLLD